MSSARTFIGTAALSSGEGTFGGGAGSLGGGPDRPRRPQEDEAGRPTTGHGPWFRVWSAVPEPSAPGQ